MDNLQQKAQTALLDDPRTKGVAIEILNENGIITLSGIVSQPKTSEAAEAVVRDVDGVASVVNEIQVRKNEEGGAFDVSGTLDEDIIVK